MKMSVGRHPSRVFVAEEVTTDLRANYRAILDFDGDYVTCNF